MRGAGGWATRLADSLADAAQRTPQRVVLIDSDREVDCRSLHEQATALAAAMLDRMPIGSVVSFMLPNWHEAAVIYLAATLAGMVVNPILPSLRDHELLFILDDANTRMIFVPSVFGRHDYASMLARVVATDGGPTRGRRGAQRRIVAGSANSPHACPRWIPMLCG